MDEHVEEALALVEKMGHNSSVGHVDPLKRRFKQQAAFIYFARSELEVALDLFLDSEVDERELISLFPGLLPSSTCQFYYHLFINFLKKSVHMPASFFTVIWSVLQLLCELFRLSTVLLTYLNFTMAIVKEYRRLNNFCFITCKWPMILERVCFHWYDILHVLNVFLFLFAK